MARHLSFGKNLRSLAIIEPQISKLNEQSGKISTQPRVPRSTERVELETALPELKYISPMWDSRISQKWPRPFSRMWFKWYFELKRTSKCVVGEAYGFSSSYIHRCKECDDIGWKFMIYFTLNLRRKLDLNKERFVRHWNEIHMPSINIALHNKGM
jgi:hypothetical protein